MTNFQWECFNKFRNTFKDMVTQWNNQAKSLIIVQEKAMDFFKNVDYELQTPIVYNTALDEITQNDEIKLIVIGDNPGKDEQLIKNQKYLVGQAGKLGNSFFKNHDELGIDFRKNVIILNKTPIHSAKTNQLKKFATFGGKEIENLLKETQVWMAQETAKLHQKLLQCSENKDFPQLWLVGYSELKEKGIFTDYKNELKKQYQTSEEAKNDWDNVFVYQHFSMNRFSIDLKEFSTENKNLDLKTQLKTLGKKHKDEIF
ncbi:MAG: hypothetical protein IJ937_05810 [Treponema sp.]|nr:hypothetical protein [Treponema sp.]